MLVGMLAAMVLLNYVDRGAIGIAAPLMKQELALSATQFGLAVSAFFWIYAPVQFIVGWLCDRFCVYRLLAFGLALWAVSTTLTAFAGGLAGLIMLRVLLGLGESVAFPGSSKIIAREVANEHRGTANALIAAALAFGPAFGTLAGGMILGLYGWRAVFLIFGLLTFLWLLPWWRISRPYRQNGAAARQTPYPIARIFRTPALWLSSAAHFCSNYAFYFLLAWLPLYLVKSRGFSIGDMTLLATATYAGQGVSALVAGRLSDGWVRRGRDEGQVRRWLMIVSQAMTALCIVGAALAPSNGALAAWLLLSGIGGGIAATNIFAIGQMFAGPRAAGSWIGMQNALGNISGIVGPVITGVIIDSTGSYFAAFALTAGVAALGALIWLFAIPPIRSVLAD
ncbi:MFS transporter [Sphingomonas sp.]|uniref:MFS transporter n=1 Tax=Sphingomonas sp. TaxID=28214 RepID=UPI0025D763DA|nr:MFS transporter [Sphingomonas sp.]